MKDLTNALFNIYWPAVSLPVVSAATSMLVDIGDWFEMLATDRDVDNRFLHWKSHQHNKKVLKIMILQHLKTVTVIKSPISVWPTKIDSMKHIKDLKF